MRPSRWISTTAALLFIGTASATASTTPTRTEFETRVTGLLSDRHGTKFTDAPVRYVKCPAAQLSRDRNYGGEQDCRYEFGTKNRRTAGEVIFYDNFGGGGEFRPHSVTNTSFALAPRACTGRRRSAGFSDPTWTNRSLRATADDPYWCHTAGEILDRLAATTHGTKRLPKHRTVRSRSADPGYAALDNWACSRTGTRSQTVTCRNGLNHQITAQLEPTA